MAANNVSVTVRPSADLRAWDVVGASSAAAAVGRDVSQPAYVDPSQYIWAGGSPDSVAEVSLGPPPGGVTTDPSYAWFFANTGAQTTLLVEVLWHGAVQGQATVSPGSGFAWSRISFTPDPTSQAAVVLRFTAVDGGDSNVRAAYVDYTTQGSPTIDGRVRVAGPTDKVRPQAAVTAGPQVATLIGGVNECLAFQIVVQAGQSPLPNLTVSVPATLVGDNGQTIPASAVRVYRVAYYLSTQVTSPDAGPAPIGAWPDPLIPSVDAVLDSPEARNAFPVNVPAGENRVAWVEILVPAGTPPGNYSGSVHVSADGLAADVPVQLEVLAFTLPATATLSSAFLVSLDPLCRALGLNIDTTEGWQCLQRVIRLGLNNRITVASQLRFVRGGSNDLADFESYILPLIQGSDGHVLLPGAKMTSVDIPHEGDGQQLPAWRPVAEANGFVGRAFVYDTDECDEIGSHPNTTSWTTCRDQRVSDVEGNWPEAAVMLTASIQDIQNWQNAEPPGPVQYIDTDHNGRILSAPVIDQMDNPSSGNQRPQYDGFLQANAGNRLWLYTSCDTWGCTGNDGRQGWAGYQIDAPGTVARSMGWLCFIYGTTGQLYYDIAAAVETAWNPGGQWNNAGNGDGTLLYPGTPSTQVGDGTMLGGATSIPLEQRSLQF